MYIDAITIYPRHAVIFAIMGGHHPERGSNSCSGFGAEPTATVGTRCAMHMKRLGTTRTSHTRVEEELDGRRQTADYETTPVRIRIVNGHGGINAMSPEAKGFEAAPPLGGQSTESRRL